MSQKRGILYITTGDDPYYTQAIDSCRSAKKEMPQIQTAIITDHNNPSKIFDNIIQKEDMHDGDLWKGKPAFINESPFEQTLFVDSDTYFVNSINEIWDILDYYDIAAAHTTHRRYDGPVPIPMAEYNTGVILFEKNKNTELFFNDWEKNHGELGENIHGTHIKDQPSFRHCLFQHTAVKNNIKFLTLAPEYNALIGNNVGFLRGEVKIIHSEPKGLTFEEVAKLIDSTTEKRVYFPKKYSQGYAIRTNNPFRLANLYTHPKFIKLLSKLGIKNYASYIYSKLLDK